MNDEDHVLLSGKLEGQLKAVEWAHEQKKILDDKSRRIAAPWKCISTICATKWAKPVSAPCADLAICWSQMRKTN